MPLVPSYNSNIQEQGIPSARIQSTATAEAFGGGKAGVDPFKDVSETVVKIAYEEKKRYDQVAVQNYDTKLSKLETDIQTKASQMKGKDALGVQDFIDEEWQKGKSALDETLNNDQQRAAAYRLAGKRYESLYKFGLTHSTAETAKYELDSTKSAVAVYQNEAAVNYQNPERVVDSLNRQVTVLTDYASKHGLIGSPQFEEAVSDATGKTHQIVINQMLSSHQDLAAKKYFDEFKGELGQYRDNVQKQVEAGSLRGESQQIVDSYFKKELSDTEVQDEIRSIESPELRDAVSDRYQHQRSIQSQIQKQAYESTTNDLFNVIDQTKSIDSVVTDPRWASLSHEDKKKMRSYAKDLQEGNLVEKNSDEYYYLLRMASEDPKEFTSKNLLMFKPDVEGSQLTHLMELQRNLNEKKAKGEEILGGIRSKTSIVDGVLKEMKIPPNPKPGTKDAKRANDFRRLVDEEVVSRERQTGKKITNDELDIISKKLGKDVVTQKRSFWFDKTKKEFELDVSDIPSVDLGQIDSALKQMNLPITDSLRLKLYRGKLNAR